VENIKKNAKEKCLLDLWRNKTDPCSVDCRGRA